MHIWEVRALNFSSAEALSIMPVKLVLIAAPLQLGHFDTQPVVVRMQPAFAASPLSYFVSERHHLLSVIPQQTGSSFNNRGKLFD